MSHYLFYYLIITWFRARFTKQGKLARERNSKNNSVGDLLTMRKLKNTDAISHLHIDQRNMPSAAQIIIVANEQSRCSSGVGDLLMTQVQNSLIHALLRDSF